MVNKRANTKPLVEHNYKVIVENKEPLFFINLDCAKIERSKYKKAHIMLRLDDGSYVPIAE